MRDAATCRLCLSGPLSQFPLSNCGLVLSYLSGSFRFLLQLTLLAHEFLTSPCPSIAGLVLSTPISGLSSWHTYYARPCLLNEEVPCPMWVACRLAHRTLLWSLAAAVLEWPLLYKGQQGMPHSQTFLILKPRRDSQNQNYIKKPRTEVPTKAPALLSWELHLYHTNGRHWQG